MTHEKENARPVAGTTEQAAGKDLDGQNSHTHYSTESQYTGAISKYLLEGSQNGLHLRDLARITGDDERIIRKLIAQERKQGVPILSDNINGYFLPGSDEERRRCVRSLRHRAMEILKAALAIEEVGGTNG